MKLTLHQITEGEDEIVICYRSMTPRIETLVEFVRGDVQKIPAVWEEQTVYLAPEEIFYLENVDGITYAYLADKVARISSSLKALELRYTRRGFFRCAKATGNYFAEIWKRAAEDTERRRGRCGIDWGVISKRI